MSGDIIVLNLREKGEKQGGRKHITRVPGVA